VGYRTIVLGTDGSVTATGALRAAVRFATRCKAMLVLVCAFDPPRISRTMAETVLEHAARSARREGVEVEVEARAAEPAELILGIAERRGAGLVVVGNKGIGEATRFRLGSVPDRVAHQAGCDVLVVDTSDAPGPTRADRGYRTLLIGTDGSATASEAARKGLELAMILRAEAELIYVGDPIVGAITLEETAATAPERVTVRTHVTQGDPTDRIVGVATEVDADLVVVGNKGMSGARRFLLGSVPNRLAHAVPTDILIIKTVDRALSDIAPGHGAVVTAGGRRLAVYRDDEGGLHAVSPRCTHLGCTVDWNDADRTWDCPCHGSRYGTDGAVMKGPAEKGLAPAEVSE
jgi:nucleotide-binding universal stress UspA family protein/nitrite reductase/ring-hydroxylating ferredoxin subunit